MMGKQELVYAFDFGTSSLGEAVRRGDFIEDRASLLIEEDVAKISDQAKRRRAHRTREAHKTREKSLDRICAEVGIPVLARDDEQMRREFPKPGDNTCYTSCLLRIKLLRGEALEGWQVYKALHSAIQRRGYDVLWKKEEEEDNSRKSEDEKKFEQKREEFKNEFARLPEDCRYPCYFDAWKMGLWSPKKNTLRLRIDCHAERARDWIIPRDPVMKEVEALLVATAAYYPKLAGRINKFLFKKGEKEFASYFDLREAFPVGRAADGDWDGIMGQKTPRFNNRIIGKCVLMPRRNVCRASDGLVQQVRFLLSLKNMRFERDGRDDMLTPAEMNQLLQAAIEKEKNEPTKEGHFKQTESQWKKFVISIGGNAKIDDKIKPPSRKGRARFCRPALRLLRELLTTDISPAELYERCKREIREGVLKLNDEDIAFLKRMPEAWKSLYIPDSKMDTLLHDAGGDADRAIVTLIGSQINPVVRHRLFFFYEELQRLREKHGEPDKVALEFVREDFMGKKAKDAYNQFVKDRTDDNSTAEKELKEFGLAPSSRNRLKMKLLIEQGEQCLYTGETLSKREIDSYEIDHVVPRGRGGSDSYLNVVLTKSHTNQKEKGDQTPYEWLKRKGHWEAYLGRIKEAKISKKKKRLLTAENAAELDERYTTLAETAWISKLARKIVCLYFNWREGEPGQERRCQIVSGGLTARFRARYGLNGILAPDDLSAKGREKKYRGDKRHHALDAMVLSYIPNWAADKSKRGFLKFPDSIGDPYEYFKSKLADVIPETVFHTKPQLEETSYAKRTIDSRERMTVRRKLKSLPYKSEKGKTVFRPDKSGKDADQIVDKRIRGEVKEVLEGLAAVADKEQREKIWRDFVEGYRLDGPGGKGPRVKYVACEVGSPDEYRDLGKSHQTKGQYRKGKKHQGYFVVIDEKGRPKVEPVYVFESLYERKKAIFESGRQVLDFFHSGCLVVVENETRAGRTVIPPGVYRCATIKSDGIVILQDAGIEHKIRLSTVLRFNPNFRRFNRRDRM